MFEIRVAEGVGRLCGRLQAFVYELNRGNPVGCASQSGEAYSTGFSWFNDQKNRSSAYSIYFIFHVPVQYINILLHLLRKECQLSRKCGVTLDTTVHHAANCSGLLHGALAVTPVASEEVAVL